MPLKSWRGGMAAANTVEEEEGMRGDLQRLVPKLRNTAIKSESVTPNMLKKLIYLTYPGGNLRCH